MSMFNRIVFPQADIVNKVGPEAIPQLDPLFDEFEYNMPSGTTGVSTRRLALEITAGGSARALGLNNFIADISSEHDWLTGVVTEIIGDETKVFNDDGLATEILLDKGSVHAGGQHLVKGWHCDAGERKRYLVANALPTQVAYGKISYRYFPEWHLPRNQRDYWNIPSSSLTDLVDDWLSQGKLKVQQPDELEVVQIDNTVVHGSAPNLGRQALNRSLLTIKV